MKRGYRMKPENLRSWLRPIRVLFDALGSRNWYKLCQNYTNTNICKILYKIRNIKQIIFNKYATNLKTTIFQRSLRNSGVLLFLFEYNNLFFILIDIIDNIIYTSGPWHQHSNQWQRSIMVTCLQPVSHDQYTALSLEAVLATWYWRISYIYTFWYNFDTVLSQFLETETSARTRKGFDQFLSNLSFSLYPPFIFLYIPFKLWF